VEGKNDFLFLKMNQGIKIFKELFLGSFLKKNYRMLSIILI
jgi:hypothetical protein